MFGNSANRFGAGLCLSGLSLFCIDPGETTGWAWCCVAYKELQAVWSGGSDGLSWSGLFKRLIEGGRFQSGQIEVYRGPLASSSLAARVAIQEAQVSREIGIEIVRFFGVTSDVTKGKINQVTDVIFEDFVLRESSKGRSLLSPVRITAGVVQEVLNMDELIGLTFQSPSDAKSVVTDDRLRSLGLWQVGQVHARDACRHMALFLRRLDG